MRCFMKSNLFKYIFILFAIGIVAYSVYAIYFKDKKDVQEGQNEVVQQEVVETKDLRLGISNFDTMNPLLSKNKEVLNIDKLIFEPLIMIDENYKANLCLAKECSKTSDTSYVIKIDNNTKWQDGSPFIAKDIQFTIDRLKEGKSIYSSLVEKVTSVEILDADTIKINLSQEVPFFEYNLTFPILPNNYYLNEDFNTSTKIPIGTGMYMISKIENGTITLMQNSKWWNRKNEQPKMEIIHIKLYEQMGELYNSFKLGNIDFFTTANTNLEEYIGTMGYAKQEFKGREFDYLAFNCQDNLLKSKEVRKAISYAIDKTNLVSTVFNNTYYVADFPLDFGSYVYEKTAASTGYNSEQAKKVLSDNGWVYKNNTWRKTEDYRTIKLNLTLTVNESNAKRVSVAENIKTQLAQIGIPVSIRKVSDSKYKTILQDKSYQMLITGVYNGFSPDVSTFFGANNLQNYSQEELNNLLTEVKNIKDENLLKEKYKRIIDIYEAEQPFISLYRNKQTAVKSQNLAGEVLANNYMSYYRFYTWYRM